MAENTNMSAVIDEVRNADEESLKKVIEDWFEKTRTAGMRIGAQYISAAVYGAIEKNIKTGSLRDHQRAIKAVLEIVSVQLNQQKTQQNDLDLPEDEEV
jgi:hypothetical protein